MLDSHPEVAIPTETHFWHELVLLEPATMTRQRFFELLVGHFTWRDFHIDEQAFWAALEETEPFNLPDAVRRFYRLYADRFGKARWGEKTPDYGQIIPQIARTLPEACFVHLIRDGRDVAVSKRHLWFGPGNDIAAQAVDWCHSITRTRAFGEATARYIEVRYERLVAKPAEVLRELCEFLDLQYSEAMLEYPRKAAERLAEQGDWPEHNVKKEQHRAIHELTLQGPLPTRVGRWRTEMSHDEIVAFESTAGQTLEEFGYARSANRAPATGATSAAGGITGLLFTGCLSEAGVTWFRRLREVVDELVIFVDTRADDRTEAAAHELASRVHHVGIRSDLEAHIEAHLPRMVETCRTEWILRIDSDEELSPEWSGVRWSELLDGTELTHFWLPRRWVTAPRRFVNVAPWWPDFQLRMFRTKSSITFPTQVHEPMSVAGRGAALRTLALHHHVFALMSRAAREQKAAKYERLRPGGGMPHYYLFEDHAPGEAPLPRATRSAAANEILEMHALSPEDTLRITLVARREPLRVKPGMLFWIEIEIANGSDRAIVSAPPYPVNVASHWLRADTREFVIFDGVRSPVFPPLAPTHVRMMSAFMTAPAKAGEYILQLTIVQEGLRWLDNLPNAHVLERVVNVTQS